MSISFEARRKKRHHRIRKAIFGTPERPRLAVYRSGKHLYAQAIDDYQRKTLFSFSTVNKKFQKKSSKEKPVEVAKKLGQLFGPELVSKGIRKIAFDRGGYQYHGRVKALAEGLRETGVEF